MGNSLSDCCVLPAEDEADIEAGNQPTIPAPFR